MMSPGLRPSESIDNVALSDVVRAFGCVAPNVADLNWNDSPSPELTMSSNEALVIEKSSPPAIPTIRGAARSTR